MNGNQDAGEDNELRNPRRQRLKETAKALQNAPSQIITCKLDNKRKGRALSRPKGGTFPNHEQEKIMGRRCR